MAVTQAFSASYIKPVLAIANPEEIAQRGVFAIFRTRSMIPIHYLLGCVERRDRAVLLLLDGRRTLRDVARLTRRNELEMAHVLVRLLKRGYIDFLARPIETKETA